ncbi:S9 family peptidase [Niabella hibiscisoli]|uniref:S9 family peptidase n=1 Tax=Niabella hibiscisoli TaxID=1825928 RepID=UPI001F0CF46B|nr:hypothetical protein [Niabella hibiscisoli]MCH5717568.1 hypothetical protein [Niabella hibiscisoli]
MPRDTLAMLTLNTGKIEKLPNLISFKTPKEPNIWIAGLFKNEPVSKPKYQSDKTKDSLKQIIDSLQYVIGSLAPAKTEGKDSVTDHGRNNKLVLINTFTGTSLAFKNVSDYVFNKKGTELLLEQTLDLKDTAKTSRVILYHLLTKKTDTLLKGGNDFKNLAISDDGSQAAFVAQRGAKAKAPGKYYTLWYFKQGMDSALMIVDTLTANFRSGERISELGKISFSKSGERLQFAIAPARPPKDTSQVDIDKVNVDIWNYKDDYLQPYQLANQKRDRERSYVAVYDFKQQKMLPLGSSYLPTVYEGTLADARYFVAVTDTGRRIASQWAGNTRKDIYKVDVANNKYIPAILNLDGDIRASWISPSGKYVLWYDNTTRHYHVFDGNNAINITAGIKVPLYDEENDVPDAPSPYGVMGWQDGDTRVLIYDRYDIWSIDPTGRTAPVNLTINGRKNKVTYRYIQIDEEEDFIKAANKNILNVFDNTSKQSGLAILENNKLSAFLQPIQPLYISQVNKAKNAPVYTYSKESYIASPDLYLQQSNNVTRLSATNPQQKNYNWGTAALYQWNTFSGKPAAGIIYKPEDFDSTKKYPVILYFYEKLTDNLYKYVPPAPTPSRLNISFFVSRGYIVMTPDISYTIGYPAKSAYDYIVSGAQSLAKKAG